MNRREAIKTGLGLAAGAAVVPLLPIIPEPVAIPAGTDVSVFYYKSRYIVLDQRVIKAARTRLDVWKNLVIRNTVIRTGDTHIIEVLYE